MRRAYELEIMGKDTVQIEQEGDVELLIRLLLPGSNNWFVVDEFGRAYIAYRSHVLAFLRRRAVKRLGRFRVRLYSVPHPEWMSG